jgi:hypothetical protein
LHIRLVDDSVDDDEPGLGKAVGDGLDCGALIKADGDDDRRAAPDQGRQCLDALAVVVDLDFVIGDAGFRLEPLGAVVGRLVEGFVELRTLRIDDRRGGLVRGGRRRDGRQNRCEPERRSPGLRHLPELREEPR